MNQLAVSDSRQLAFGGEMVGLVGMRFQHGTPIESWMQTVRSAMLLSRVTPWIIGDAMNFGEGEYGEDAAAVLDATGLEQKTLENYRWVANRFPIEQRRESVSFALHGEVAAWDDREAWLDRIEEEGWNRAELRRQLALARGDSENPNGPQAAFDILEEQAPSTLPEAWVEAFNTPLIERLRELDDDEIESVDLGDVEPGQAASAVFEIRENGGAVTATPVSEPVVPRSTAGPASVADIAERRIQAKRDKLNRVYNAVVSENSGVESEYVGPLIFFLDQAWEDQAERTTHDLFEIATGFRAGWNAYTVSENRRMTRQRRKDLEIILNGEPVKQARAKVNAVPKPERAPRKSRATAGAEA